MILTRENDERVQKFIRDHKNPIVLYFTAHWCSSCKAIESILEPLAAENVGLIHVLKIDVEHCPQTSARFLIRGLPTVILYWRDDVQNVIVGAKLADKNLYAELFTEKGDDVED